MKAATRRLANGLTVVTRESRGAPVVALQLWVGVGSADEKPHEAGLAHVLEHMLFKGTPSRPVGEVARDVERAGGHINAWTSHDETVYHITIASNFAREGLDVLADAVRNSLFEPGDLASELQVILEEVRMGNDSASRTVTENLFAGLFGDHPYGRPVIGYESTIKSFDQRKVKGFHSRWYTPGNMVLVVVGDMPETTMVAEVERAFGGDWGGRFPRKGSRPTGKGSRSPKVKYKVKAVSEVSMSVGFPIPGLEDEDVPALDLLAAVVGQGASSRLESKIRRKLGLATDIRAISFTPKDRGVFAVFASTAPHRLVQMNKAIFDELMRITREPVSPAEVEKARSFLLSDAVYSEETVDGTARKLGYYGLHANIADFEGRYLAALTTADPGQLLAVAREYINPDRAVLSVVVPDPSRRSFEKKVPWVHGKGGDAQVDGAVLREKLLEPARRAKKSRGVGRVSPCQNPVVHELPGGDILIVKPDLLAGVVAARASFLGGLRGEPPRQGGLTTVLASSLTRGTKDWNAGELAARMDHLACSVSGFNGRNTTGIHGEFLSRNFADGFSLMADCLRNPVFDKDELEREKTLLVDEIRARMDSPEAVVFEMFQKELFGGHPYGRSMLGTVESIRGLTSSKLTAFHRRLTGAGKMVLAVVGGVDPLEARDLALKYILPPEGGNDGPPLGTPNVWKPKNGPRQVARDLPKEQSHLFVGYPGTTINGDDRFVVEVFVEILGGHGGRLFDSVREQLGLAYSVTATSMEGLEPGYVGVYAGTTPGREQQVFDAMMVQVEISRTKKPSPDELARVKRHLIGSRQIARQRAAARAAGASLGYLYGLGEDADDQYTRQVAKVTGAQVVEVAHRLLDPRHMVVSVVGPRVEHLKLV